MKSGLTDGQNTKNTTRYEENDYDLENSSSDDDFSDSDSFDLPGEYYRKEGGILGGYSGLRSYGGSAHSNSNEKLIRSIAEDMAKVLNISGDFAKKDSLDEVVKKLQQKLPDPGKGKWIKSEEDAHFKICKKLAESINERYGEKLIDKNADHKVICQSVSEVVQSLGSGIKKEVSSVKSDVGKQLKNLQVLQKFVDGIQKDMPRYWKKILMQKKKLMAFKHFIKKLVSKLIGNQKY